MAKIAKQERLVWLGLTSTWWRLTLVIFFAIFYLSQLLFKKSLVRLEYSLSTNDQAFKGFCSLQHCRTVADGDNSPWRASQLMETNHRLLCRSWQMFWVCCASRWMYGPFLTSEKDDEEEKEVMKKKTSSNFKEWKGVWLCPAVAGSWPVWYTTREQIFRYFIVTMACPARPVHTTENDLWWMSYVWCA